MLKEQTCRHCEERFTPETNKRGYIDECPGCLPRPVLSAPLTVRKARPLLSEAEKAERRLYRRFLKMGCSRSQIDAWIAEHLHEVKPPSKSQRWLAR
jgi:hypothetical protein